MITTIRTDSDNPDFRQLVSQLDHYLAMLDGAEHAFTPSSTRPTTCARLLLLMKRAPSSDAAPSEPLQTKQRK
ncbi:hypothetical protein ACQ86N_18830 [Puia sp. P3]|uniref:hypothetical protein n=1 Tax=Puia sp. P3 TaxID=3423952 RepID=UPI003D6672EC